MYTGLAKVHLSNEVAVRQGSHVLSFKELDTYSMRLAEWLLGRGLTQGDWVLVQTPMCVELAVIECAVHMAGLQIARVCPSLSPEEMGRIVETRTVRAFIASSALCTYSTKIRGFESATAFASVGAPVNGYAEYGQLIAGETSQSSSQRGGRLQQPTPPAVKNTSNAATASNLTHLRCRVALVGPFNRASSQVMQPYLESGNSLVLFDNIRAPEFGRAIAAKNITHVLLAADTALQLIRSSPDTTLEDLDVVVMDVPTSGHIQNNTCHANGTSDERDCAAAEAVLLAHPAVMEACVIKVPDEGKEERLKAVVALRPGGRASAAELIAHCLAGLPYNQCPASVSFIAELPKNVSGKPARKLLREQYLQAYRLPY